MLVLYIRQIAGTDGKESWGKTCHKSLVQDVVVHGVCLNPRPPEYRKIVKLVTV